MTNAFSVHPRYGADRAGAARRAALARYSLVGKEACCFFVEGSRWGVGSESVGYRFEFFAAVGPFCSAGVAGCACGVILINPMIIG